MGKLVLMALEVLRELRYGPNWDDDGHVAVDMSPYTIGPDVAGAEPIYGPPLSWNN